MLLLLKVDEVFAAKVVCGKGDGKPLLVSREMPVNAKIMQRNRGRFLHSGLLSCIERAPQFLCPSRDSTRR